MSAASLDCRPLPAPVNPFAWMAVMIRAENYPTQELATQAGQIARWLEYLAARTPDVASADPLLLAAIARLGNDGAAREQVKRAIAAIEAEVARAQPAPTNGHAAPGGFRAT